MYLRESRVEFALGRKPLRPVYLPFQPDEMNSGFPTRSDLSIYTENCLPRRFGCSTGLVLGAAPLWPLASGTAPLLARYFQQPRATQSVYVVCARLVDHIRSFRTPLLCLLAWKPVLIEPRAECYGGQVPAKHALAQMACFVKLRPPPRALPNSSSELTRYITSRVLQLQQTPKISPLHIFSATPPSPII